MFHELSKVILDTYKRLPICLKDSLKSSLLQCTCRLVGVAEISKIYKVLFLQ